MRCREAVGREAPFLPRDEFWAVVEDCRRRSIDSRPFAETLSPTRAGWDFPKIAAFHNTLWYDIGVFHKGRLVRSQSSGFGGEGGLMVKGPSGRALHLDRTAAGRAARRLRNSRVPELGGVRGGDDAPVPALPDKPYRLADRRVLRVGGFQESE
jgi:hypothetical protein